MLCVFISIFAIWAMSKTPEANVSSTLPPIPCHPKVSINSGWWKRSFAAAHARLDNPCASKSSLRWMAPDGQCHCMDHLDEATNCSSATLGHWNHKGLLQPAQLGCQSKKSGGTAYYWAKSASFSELIPRLKSMMPRRGNLDTVGPQDANTCKGHHDEDFSIETTLLNSKQGNHSLNFLANKSHRVFPTQVWNIESAKTSDTILKQHHQ